MDIFREIIDWSQSTLPTWAQEAVNRIVSKAEFTDQDLHEVLKLVKSEGETAVEPVDIPDPQPAGPNAVSLVALEHAHGVNAIVEGETLTFGCPTGLTVVYGDNGSGKTGYSKVLKHACRSREKAPPLILGDVFADIVPPAPEAVFTLNEDGAEHTERWTPSSDPSDALGSIALFDSSCCRAYVEEDGDPAYRPYGLEVFDQLGGAYVAVKDALAKEAAGFSVPDFPTLTHPTVAEAVNRVMTEFTEGTRTKVTELASLSTSETQRIDKLQAQVAKLETSDPKKLAELRRRLATSLDAVVQRITIATATIENQLKLACGAVKERDATAKLAEDASMMAFDQEPVRGVASTQWKKMFEYAREFSVEVAYPHETFPYLGEDAKCVLCHQPLGKDAVERMTRFAEFVGNKAEGDAKAALAGYEEARSAVIETAKSAATVEDALIDQAEGHSEGAAIEMRSAKEAYGKLQATAETAATEDAWSLLDVPGVETRETTELVARLRTDADEYERNSYDAERGRLKDELALLRDRQQLAKLKEDVLRAAELANGKRRLSHLAEGITTRPITDKAREITKEVVTKELCATLNAELKGLSAGELEVEFATKGSGGSQLHYLRFIKAPKHARIEDILSEGEYRALGIAAFLTELDQAGHRSAIILDDPVSSLDHLHRDAVADRLVEEAKHRQVIIFTHDLAFLYALERAAAKHQVRIHRQAVRRTDEGTGVVSKGIYPEEMSLKDLIAYIREKAEATAALDNHHPDRRKGVVKIYDLIRAAWERVVEEVLLRQVVSPFDKAVHTAQLKGVVVADEDYRTVFWAMGAASEIIEAHRTPAGSGPTTLPSDEQIATDIEELDSFRKEKTRRGDEVARERKKLEVPPVTG